MENNRLLKFFKLDKVIDSTTHYVETRLELFKLEARDEISKIVAYLLKSSLLLILISIAMLFISIACALLLGDYTGNPAYGFLIIAGLYLLTALLLYVFRDKLQLRTKLKKYLRNIINELNNE